MENQEKFTVSAAFSSGAVLQRNVPVCVWGRGENGREILARLGEFEGRGRVEGGRWSLFLPAMAANAAPQTLTVTDGVQTISIDDVLVGDVYFIGGQSNADFMMQSSDTYEAQRQRAKEGDNIRFFCQRQCAIYADMGGAHPDLGGPLEDPFDASFHWQKTSPGSIAFLSALGYYFAKEVSDKTNHEIPIGLLEVAFGGAYLKDLSPNQINQAYHMTEGNAGYIYNALIAPFVRYTACAMVYYQGESDSFDMRDLKTFPRRFCDYVSFLEGQNQNKWDIYLVQLSSHSADPAEPTSPWQIARFRAMQFDLAKEMGYSLIVTLDKGVRKADPDKAHPLYKLPIGQRLANQALVRRYGFSEEQCPLCPLPKSVSYTESGAVLTFSHASGGLRAAFGKEILGFELICGGKAVSAQAEVTAPDEITVLGCQNPAGVRYGFYMEASQKVANLVNGACLPCPTFAFGADAAEIPMLSPGELDD